MSKFRLALRVEGEFWNAYLAGMDTMDNALLLGSIRMSVVTNNKRIKSQFMSLMQDTISYAIKNEFGITIKKWERPRTAPKVKGHVNK